MHRIQVCTFSNGNRSSLKLILKANTFILESQKSGLKYWKKTSDFQSITQLYYCYILALELYYTVEATYKGRLYKGTAAYKGTH